MKTLLDYAKEQLRALARVCSFSPEDIEHAVGLCEDLCASWGDRNVLDTPRWSGLTDDCSPFEFSIAIGDKRHPDLRMLIEVQADPPSPQKYWEAAWRLSEKLSKRYGAGIERLERVIDLFRPTDHVYFAMLHGVVFRPGARPLFKAYLNPKAKGGSRSRDVVNDAIEKLGHMDAWLRIASSMRDHDELQFLCLDLETSDEARSKLYIRHRFCTPDNLERASAVATGWVPGDAKEFSEAIFGSVPVLPRAPLTMYTFVAGRSLPVQAAVHLPTFPYGGCDGVMRDRISSLLTRCCLPTDAYLRSLDALSVGPLSEEIGIHNYISFQRLNGVPRITVYLCPRMYLYRLGAIGFDPQTAWPSPVN